MDNPTTSLGLGFNRLLNHLNVTLKDLQNPSRHQALSNKRKVVAYVLKARSPLTLHEIARVFNRSDHTTAIYWIQWCESCYKTNPHFQRMIEACLMHYDTAETEMPSPSDLDFVSPRNILRRGEESLHTYYHVLQLENQGLTGHPTPSGHYKKLADFYFDAVRGLLKEGYVSTSLTHADIQEAEEAAIRA